jgi:hypothetical protein
MDGLAIYGTDRIQTIGELKKGLLDTFGMNEPGTELAHKSLLKSNVFKIFIVTALMLAVILIIIAINTKNKEVLLSDEMIDEQADIPPDAISFNGHSYYLYNPDSKTWDRVLRDCAANGGYPAVINNKEENEFLFKYMKEKGLESAFIGYTDLDEEGTWKWVYGKESDFQDWGTNARGQQQPNQENRNEDWAQFDTRMLNGYWNDGEYGNKSYAYFCEWDTSTSSSMSGTSSGTVTNEEDSSSEEGGTIQAQKEEQEENDSHFSFKYPDGTVEYRGHHYYIYNDNRGSWENAAERCVARGGYMAVINDSEENEFLYKYILSMDFDGAFFGLVRDDSKNWRYLGGDTSDFEDWGENSKGIKEPNDQDGQSKYASMNIHMNNGHWDDVEYGAKVYTPEGKPYQNLYTYICEWDE